jgi:hypothetical protein
VGSLIALAFVLTLDDPWQFPKSRPFIVVVENFDLTDLVGLHRLPVG